MRNFFRSMLTLFFGVFISFPAQAYLDPGTGSLFIQGILAAVTSTGVALKIYWSRIVKILDLWKNKGVQSTTKNDNED